jgi:hypothetical protein
VAVRKETMKKQFAEAQAALLEPGERALAGSYTLSGPTPWLMSGVGLVIMWAMGMRPLFVVVTDRRVLFIRASFWTARPKGLAFADPRAGSSISDMKRARLWSHLRYHRPGGENIRLNFHRIWRDEMQSVADTLAAPSVPPPPQG